MFIPYTERTICNRSGQFGKPNPGRCGLGLVGSILSTRRVHYPSSTNSTIRIERETYVFLHTLISITLIQISVRKTYVIMSNRRRLSCSEVVKGRRRERRRCGEDLNTERVGSIVLARWANLKRGGTSKNQWDFNGSQ